MLQLGALLFVAALGVILLVVQSFPVLHDYPEWMYQGHIVYSLLTGEPSVLSQTFEWVPVPVPNAISQIFIGGLNFVVSPVLAGQIWLGAYLLLACSTGYVATRARLHSGSMFWLFMVTIAFGPGFWNGYINFQWGLMLLALFVATGARRHLLWVLVFSIAIYFSHASVFAGFVCYVLLVEVFNQRRPGIALSLLPSLALLLWYTVTRLADGEERNIGVGSVAQWVQYKAYTLAKQGPFHNFIQPDGESLLSSLHGLYLAGFAINFLVAALAGMWILSVVWQTIRHNTLSDTAQRYGLLLTVAILLLAWLIAGKNSFGVVNLGERFLIVALMLLIIQMPCPIWIQNSWVALSAVISVGTIVSLVAIGHHSEESYAVERSADAKVLESYIDDIYQHSRHKYFNHRLFIYSSLGQYLEAPDAFDQPPLIDHQSSIVRIRQQ